jgi:uncharacterized protein
MAVTSDELPVVISRARNGRGLFALRTLLPGETFLRIDGQIVHYELLWRREGSRFSANCLRYGPDTYLDPGRGPASFLNHSCRPNAAIRKEDNRLYVFAVRKIGAGAEITFDYSTTIGDDDVWTMRCRCGYGNCRRTIRNFGSLPPAVRRRYLTRGMVPGFIVRTLSDRRSGDRL